MCRRLLRIQVFPVGRAHWLTVCAALVYVVIASACAKNEAAQSQDPDASVSILLLGDAGYHLNYAWENFDDPETVEEFRTDYLRRLTWVGSPDPEAEIPPYSVLPRSGHTVLASGLQSVATAIGRYCQRQARCDFGIMLGDNIYPNGATEGRDGRPDADRFTDIFVTPYETLFSAQPDFEFDVVLGNHDWYTSVGGALAQLKFHEEHPNYHMDDLFYTRRRETPIGSVELFAIDTELLLSTVVIPMPKLTSNGATDYHAELELIRPWVTEHAMTQPDQVAWLAAKLQASDATWKIVAGHHPLWSSSGYKFAQAQALRRLLLPVLCPFADIYVAGHDHTLEIHEQSCKGYTDQPSKPLTHIVSGTGSKQRLVNYNFARRQAETMPGFRPVWAKGMIWGFAHLRLSFDDAIVTIITTPDDATGDVERAYEYEFERRTSTANRRPHLSVP